MLGGATFQDTIVDPRVDKNKAKAKVAPKAQGSSRTDPPKPKEQPKGPPKLKEQPKGPKWARSAGRKYMDWFTRHNDDHMRKEMLNMMTTPAQDKGAESETTLDREIDLIKAIQKFSGIERIEDKDKMGWNDKDFTVWLFLEFEGKVKKYPK
jgi:hypothetical protein